VIQIFSEKGALGYHGPFVERLTFYQLRFGPRFELGNLETWLEGLPTSRTRGGLGNRRQRFPQKLKGKPASLARSFPTYPLQLSHPSETFPLGG